MGIQGEFFERPEPALPVELDEPQTDDSLEELTDEPLQESDELEMEEETEVATDEAVVIAEFSDNHDDEETSMGTSKHVVKKQLAPKSEPKAVPTAATKASQNVEPKTGAKRGLRDLAIPKLYYSISEVSRLTGLEPYVLRYWETEFDELHPQKNRAGNRIYSNKDIQFVLRIKELLRGQRYTIEGAKHILRDERIAEKERQANPPAEVEIHDPAQIAIPQETPAVRSAAVTMDELASLRKAVVALKELLQPR